MRVVTKRDILNAYTMFGKDVRFKVKGGVGQYTVGTVEDEVSVITGEYKHVMHRIRLAPGPAKWWKSLYAYRTGYYTWTADKRRVVWGQFHQLILELYFSRLIKKASAKGWPCLKSSGRA